MKTAVGSKYGAHNWAYNRDLGQLEGDGADMAHTPAPILISMSCRLVDDQAAIDSGSLMRARRSPKLRRRSG